MAEKVSYKSKSGKSASGELVASKKGGKAPAVLVIQEWWGVDDHILSLLDRLAAEGFLAFAPDLYHGKVVKRGDAASAQAAMASLDKDEALQAIAGAEELLKNDPRSNGKVGIIGFCMGGMFAFAAARAIPDLKAAVPFYGLNPSLDYSQTKVPVQAHFAKKDEWATVGAAEGVKKQIEAGGGSMELHAYDAGHAFMNDKRPEAYDEASAKLAWKRAVDFLHAKLG